MTEKLGKRKKVKKKGDVLSTQKAWGTNIYTMSGINWKFGSSVSSTQSISSRKHLADVPKRA